MNKAIGVSSAGFTIYEKRPSTCNYNHGICNKIPAICLKGEDCDDFEPVDNIDEVNGKIKKKNDVGSTTLREIIYNVNTSRGAPMGRCGVGDEPKSRVYDRYVPMDRSDPAYDIGGAYWGLGARLRVAYTADMEYVRFYREGE